MPKQPDTQFISKALERDDLTRSDRRKVITLLHYIDKGGAPKCTWGDVVELYLMYCKQVAEMDQFDSVEREKFIDALSVGAEILRQFGLGRPLDTPVKSWVAAVYGEAKPRKRKPR